MIMHKLTHDVLKSKKLFHDVLKTKKKNSFYVSCIGYMLLAEIFLQTNPNLIGKSNIVLAFYFPFFLVPNLGWASLGAKPGHDHLDMVPS